MKRSIVVVAAVVVVLAGGWLLLRARARAEQPKFRTAQVERGDIEVLVSATGTINPVVQVEVGSQVSGTVQTIKADFNDRVRRGETLCQIEPSSFRARVVQGEAQVARAEAALKDAQRKQKRAHDLLAQNVIAQAEVDDADIVVEQSQAELKQARAQLQQWQVDLTNTTIKSPIDGVVIARSIDVGQTVAASLQAPKLFVIANDLTQMQVETRIDEADIGVVHQGLKVRFTVDAFPDETFEGQVSQVRIEPETVQGVVTYATIIRTSNPDQRLKPGMTANVSVLVASLTDVIKVPNAALRFRPPGASGGPGRGGAGAAALGGAGGSSAGGSAAGGRGAGAGGLGAGGTGARGSSVGGPGARGSGAGVPGGGDPRGFANGAPGRGGFARGDSSRHGEWVGRGGGRGGPAGWGHWGQSGRGDSSRVASAGGQGAPPSGRIKLKPGVIYLLENGKPSRTFVLSGDTDGAFTQVVSDSLEPGEQVIVGVVQTATGANLQPPPGMGGPFGGGGGRGGRGR